MRDSTLRAIALGSRSALRLYQPSLFRDVTATTRTLLPLYKLLKRDPQYARVIKTIRFAPPTEFKDGEIAAHNMELFFLSGAPFPTGEDAEEIEPEVSAAIEKGHNKLLKLTYSKVKNLETLVIEDMRQMFPLQRKLKDGRWVPTYFLQHSLKKLWLGGVEEGNEFGVSARNTVWLLIWCGQLKAAGLGITIDKKDFDYLEEFSESFQNLSNIEELALTLTFAFDKSNKLTWWGLPGESKPDWQGRSKKSQSLYLLFQVAKKLKSLEVFAEESVLNGADRTITTPSCLLGLKTSFQSLTFVTFKSLSTFSIGYDLRI